MIKENFIKLFETSFQENWDLPAFTDYTLGTSMTYGEAAKKIEKLHLLFKDAKIQQGDKIALIGKNTPHWAISFVATVTYGAVIVPILQDFNPNDVHHIVNHSEAVFLFCSDSIWDNLEEEKMENIQAAFSIDDFRCIHQKDGAGIQKILSSLEKKFDKKYPQGFSATDINYAKRDNSELAMLNYTSGTTGFSKGVMLTANNLAGNITFGFNTQLLKKGDRVLSFLPLAHAYGCAFDFLVPTCLGCHIHFLNKIPSPKVLLKAFEDVKPNVIFMVPLILEKVYKKSIQPSLNKTGIKLALNIPLLNKKIYDQVNKKLTESFGGEFTSIVVGGAALNKEVEEFLTKIGFRFTIGYGMTECGPLISYASYQEFVPSSAGKILDTMQVRIDSPDPYNIVGEILVKGEHVMLGYYKNETATSEVFTEDGWLKTGDLGTIDEHGYIFIKGRSKSMILGANGQNIYPEEIEAKLNNLPFIMESLVIEKNGKLLALVYPDYEAMDASQLSQHDLEIIMEENRNNLNKVVGTYENLAKIHLYPNEFEKTPKKSIKRYLYNNISV
jgi:long-chain acyl-CoA synthetase